MYILIKDIRTFLIYNLDQNLLKMISSKAKDLNLDTFYVTNASLLLRTIGINTIKAFFDKYSHLQKNGIFIINIADHIPSFFSALSSGNKSIFCQNLSKVAINICNKYKIQFFKI